MFDFYHDTPGSCRSAATTRQSNCSANSWVWGAALTTLFTIIVGSHPTMPTLAARVSRPIAGRGE